MLTGTNFTNTTKLIFEPPTSKVAFGVRFTRRNGLSFVASAKLDNRVVFVVLLWLCFFLRRFSRLARALVLLFGVIDIVGNFRGRSLLPQVLSSTRIAIFLKGGNSYLPKDGEPLKIVAIDNGAGAEQIKPEGGGLTIGYAYKDAEDDDKQAS